MSEVKGRTTHAFQGERYGLVSSRPFPPGFTLIELLVVIAVIGILSALLLSALSAAKERATRIRCLSNIKQFDLASLSYAHDNNDRFPSIADEERGFNGHGAGTVYCWQFLPGDSLTRQYGLSPSVLYDPGIPKNAFGPAYSSTDPSLRLPLLDERTYDDTRVLQLYGNRGHLIGYVHTFPGDPLLTQNLGFSHCIDPTNWNWTTIPQPISVVNIVLPPPKSSERALVAGLMEAQIYVSGPIFSGEMTTFFHRPAHLSKGRNASPDPLLTPVFTANPAMWLLLPSGDNVGYLDGSARWRNLKDMTKHGKSGVTYYW